MSMRYGYDPLVTKLCELFSEVIELSLKKRVQRIFTSYKCYLHYILNKDAGIITDYPLATLTYVDNLDFIATSLVDSFVRYFEKKQKHDVVDKTLKEIKRCTKLESIMKTILRSIERNVEPREIIDLTTNSDGFYGRDSLNYILVNYFNSVGFDAFTKFMFRTANDKSDDDTRLYARLLSEERESLTKKNKNKNKNETSLEVSLDYRPARHCDKEELDKIKILFSQAETRTKIRERERLDRYALLIRLRKEVANIIFAGAELSVESFPDADINIEISKDKHRRFQSLSREVELRSFVDVAEYLAEVDLSKMWLNLRGILNEEKDNLRNFVFVDGVNEEFLKKIEELQKASELFVLV